MEPCSHGWQAGTSAVRAEFRFDLPPRWRYIDRTRELLLRQCCFSSRSGTAAYQCATATNGLKLASANPYDYQAVLNLNTDQHIGNRGAVLLSDWEISPESSLHAI